MAEHPKDARTIAPLSTEELAPRWEAFRKGAQPICPRDGGPMAVAIDATAHAYRMVCVSCGAASPWFESAPSTGIRVRSGTSSVPASRSGISE